MDGSLEPAASCCFQPHGVVHEPLAQFLREAGIFKKIDEVVASAKTRQGADRYPPLSIVIRLEDAALCSKTECVTIIGTIEAGKLGAHAMFTADRFMTAADEITHGNTLFFTHSTNFPGDRNYLTLRQTPKGWIVISPPR